MDEVERWAAAGLLDVAAPDADERLALLEYLASEGCTIEDMVVADGRGVLVAAAGDKRLAADLRFTRADAATSCGLSPEEVDRAWLAMGLARVVDGRPAFSADDVELLGAFAGASALFGFDPTLQFTRVVGTSLARMANAATTTFLVNVQRPIDIEAREPIDEAKANVLANDLLASLPEITAPLFRRLARDSIRRNRQRQPDEYDVVRMAVGFLDLVGYTAWSEGLRPDELARAVNDFEQAASDLITTSGGRVVKNIGDAVMYVFPRSEGACRVALDMCRFVDEHPRLTQIRAAVAVGDLLQWDGDYFGPTVNRAARLVKEAEPGTLVSDSVVRGLDAERLRKVTLRGVEEPAAVYRITLLTDELMR